MAPGLAVAMAVAAAVAEDVGAAVRVGVGVARPFTIRVPCSLTFPSVANTVTSVSVWVVLVLTVKLALVVPALTVRSEQRSPRRWSGW